ncbi:two component transcriptional regulator, LytTR family [Ruminococcaceae bacterium FB2012]|nr:two component transcriptional regulator, LytTR family [Ruminococcaceae bacterium FB2012]
MEIKIAVVDDLSEDREQMIGQIHEFFSRHDEHHLILHSFSSSEEFLADEARHTFHAVFLDIFMNGMTGIELGKQLREENPILAIVFVTSSPDMYSAAAPLGMFDYIEKPFEPNRINALLDRLIAYLLMIGKRAEQTVCIRIPRSKVQLRLSEIICVLSNDHITEVYSVNRGMIQSNMRYSEVADLLKNDERFIECNRGVLANMEHIVSMTDNVSMSNGLILPLKVRSRAKLLNLFSGFSTERMREY